MVNEGKFLEMHQITITKEDMENMEKELSTLLMTQKLHSATLPVIHT